MGGTSDEQCGGGGHPAAGEGLLARRASIVLFGDSLTQRGFEDGGWAAALAHHFGRRADVYNRGFGGYNSRWALHVLRELFPQTACVDADGAAAAAAAAAAAGGRGEGQ